MDDRARGDGPRDDASDDVVAQGADDRRGPPPWARGGALLAAVGLGALLLTRPHLLSSDGPTPGPDRPTAAAPTVVSVRGPNTSEGVSVVVRSAGRLVRYEAGSGRRPLAALPPGLPRGAPLVHVGRIDGTGPLLGVDGTVLFRTSPVSGRTVTGIGRARQVVGPSTNPGRVLVVSAFGGPRNGPRLVELDARTGAVTDAAPYPAFVATGPWHATAVLDLLRQSALLVTRPVAGGRTLLALAWDAQTVRRDGHRALEPIGSPARLLGVAQNRVLTVDSARCPGGGCPVTVVTVTGDRVLSRPVEAPPGWVFGPTAVSGDGGDPLVVVRPAGGGTGQGLARLAAGGRRALFIVGSQEMAPRVAPAGGSDGSVVFAVPRPEGLRLAVWRPGARAAALLLDQPALTEGSELVCACR